jgi:hypothetical protein
VVVAGDEGGGSGVWKRVSWSRWSEGGGCRWLIVNSREGVDANRLVDKRQKYVVGTVR